MANEKQPISAVRKFVDEAVRLGCYTSTQKYNFETAWAVLMKALPQANLSEASTVEQLRPKVGELLRHHGGTTKISAGSLKAYQARINRLVEDFVKYNGGDFMAWKEAKGKPAGGANGDDTKSRRRRKKATRSPSDSNDDIDSDMMSYRLIASEGKEGKLDLPNDLSEEQVESVWQQLAAIQTLVKAQLAALRGKPKGTYTTEATDHDASGLSACTA